MQRILLALILSAIFWFQGVKPLVADYYKGKNEIAKALKWAPDDSLIQMRGGNIIKTIENNNGDLTQYALWYNLAVRLLKQGSKEGGMEALKKSLYYYPDYDPAKKLLKSLEEKK